MTPTEERELRRLARARPLVTREIHPFNAFYGHDWILKRYAGQPERSVLKGAIEHGVTLDDMLPDLDRRLKLPTYLAFGSRRARLVERELPGVEAVPIGPLIRYAEALHPARPGDDGRRLLVFPAHSIQTGVVEFDVDAFLSAVREYGAEFDEVVVCLYWKDVLLGRAEAYRKRGLRCVTAGHMYDRQFLFRFLDLLRAATAVATNEVGTHVPYAVLTGKPVWIVRQPLDYRFARGTAHDQRAAADLLRTRQPELLSTLADLFGRTVREVSAEQRRFVEDLVGVEHLRSPEELRAVLARAEERYAANVPRRRRVAHRATALGRAWRGRIVGPFQAY